MKAKAVVKTLTDTRLDVLAKINTDTLTSVDAEGLVKTKGDACRTGGLHFFRHTD